MKLSKNFALWEFTESTVASRFGIDNTPDFSHIKNIKELVVNVLQPLRDKVGPVSITSGYRCKELNTEIGGSRYSQHMSGFAADIKCRDINNLELAVYIKENFVFDQLILECYDPKNPYSGWVHVSFVPGRNRKDVLSSHATPDGMVYKNGLTEYV